MRAKEVFAYAVIIHKAAVALVLTGSLDAGAYAIGFACAGFAAASAVLGIALGVDAFAIAGGLGGKASVNARALAAGAASAAARAA